MGLAGAQEGGVEGSGGLLQLGLEVGLVEGRTRFKIAHGGEQERQGGGRKKVGVALGVVRESTGVGMGLFRKPVARGFYLLVSRSHQLARSSLGCIYTNPLLKQF